MKLDSDRPNPQLVATSVRIFWQLPSSASVRSDPYTEITAGATSSGSVMATSICYVSGVCACKFSFMQAACQATLQAGQSMSGKPPCSKDMCLERHLLGL